MQARENRGANLRGGETEDAPLYIYSLLATLWQKKGKKKVLPIPPISKHYIVLIFSFSVRDRKSAQLDALNEFYIDSDTVIFNGMVAVMQG